MIRRKCVSPISAFPQGRRWIKGKHGFFIIKTGESEQAEIPGRSPVGATAQSKTFVIATARSPAGEAHALPKARSQRKARSVESRDQEMGETEADDDGDDN
jgi:hypothetical protein